MNLAELSAALGQLESFDVQAFVGDEKVPTEVCRFVLALALVHNDYKDIVLAYNLLESARPADPSRQTPDRGEYGGIQVHMIRTSAGLVHELCNLINRSDAVIKHQAFQAALRKLDKPARGSWEAWFLLPQARRAKDRWPIRSFF